MTSFAQRERVALADLMSQVGPDAPTLCGDWTTRDLAAHLLVREGSPAGIGNAVRPLSGWTEHTQRSLAGKDYGRLVEHVRNGPPLWSPLKLSKLDRALNTVEYFVHHEDVRRAAPGWQSRQLDPADDARVWRVVTKRGGLMLRNSPVGVVLATSDGRRAEAKPGSPAVTLEGDPAELLLYLFGRTEHAHVAVSGDADAVAAFRTTDLSV